MNDSKKGILHLRRWLDSIEDGALKRFFRCVTRKEGVEEFTRCFSNQSWKDAGYSGIEGANTFCKLVDSNLIEINLLRMGA